MITPVAEMAPHQVRELAFDTLGNNEVKGLAYMALVDEGQVTWCGLQKVMEARFENCQTSIGNFNSTFVKFGFAEQFTARSEDSGKNCRHFRPIGSVPAIEAIGSTLSWALQHEIALERVLSATTSVSASRAPTNSVTMLGHLLGATKVGQTDHNYSHDVFSSALTSLLTEGIVEVEDAPTFQILNPIYTGSRTLVPATQYTFETLAAAKALFPDQEWTLKQLCDLAVASAPEGLPIKQLYRDIYRVLYVMASIDRPKTYAGVLTKKDTTRGKYKVVDAYVEPISDLVESHTKLIAGEAAFLRSARDNAYDIYRQTDIAQALITRGNSASPYIKR